MIRLASGALCSVVAAALVWASQSPGPGAPNSTGLPNAGEFVPDARPRFVTSETERAIERGTRYLLRQQAADGSFRDNGAYGDYPVAMTALSGLAIAASGSTPTQGPHAPAMRRIVTYLVRSAQPNGLICRGGVEEERSLYGHGFSMLLLSEVMGMEEDVEKLAQIRYVLQRGVGIIETSQSRAGGWLYTPDMGGDEGSVTVTQVQALRAARNAGIAVPKAVIDKAMRYLDLSMQDDGGIAYKVGMTGSRPPITAAAVACWFNAGEYDHANAKRALDYCKRTISLGGDARTVMGHWFYAHLYYAQVMYLAGDENWAMYFPQVRDHLIAAQQEDGSWQGDYVGRVYGTAVALIILQLPYNQLPIMQR